MNKKFNLTETLKKEQELLLEKISKARENGDAGTYKNLIIALRDITRLIHDEEFTRERKVLTLLTDLGINIKDEDGKHRSFKLVLGDLVSVYGDLTEDAKKELIDILVNEGCVDRGSDLLNKKELRINYFSINKLEDGSYFMFIQQQDENGGIIENEFSKITELKDYSFDLNNGELTLKLQLEPTDEEFGRVRVVEKHTHEFKMN